jgi:hypothetical protein
VRIGHGAAGPQGQDCQNRESKRCDSSEGMEFHIASRVDPKLLRKRPCRGTSVRCPAIHRKSKFHAEGMSATSKILP